MKPVFALRRQNNDFVGEGVREGTIDEGKIETAEGEIEAADSEAKRPVHPSSGPDGTAVSVRAPKTDGPGPLVCQVAESTALLGVIGEDLNVNFLHFGEVEHNGEAAESA